MVLINDPDDPPTFYSQRWMTASTPDLAFASGNLANKIQRNVTTQLGGSDHRPVLLTVDLEWKLKDEKTFPRWNHKKANWNLFSQLTNKYFAFFCLVGFLTSSSTTRLYRGRAPRQERLTILRAATHETELGDHDFCLSRSMIIQTPTQPVGSGRPQRESNTGPHHQESRALPQSYRAPTNKYSKMIKTNHYNINQQVKNLNDCILQAAKETIPRGARKNYRPYCRTPRNGRYGRNGKG